MSMTATGRGCIYMRSDKAARGLIGRTIRICHCIGNTFNNGKLVDFEYDLIGGYDDPVKATNTLRRRFDDPFISITKVEVESDYYSIPISLFLKVAVNYANGRKPRYD